MISCVSCGAALPEGAAFCSACGRSQTTQSNASRASILNPEAEQAMRAATQRAQGVVANLGVEKTLSIVGGALAAIGTLLPYISITSSAAQVNVPSLIHVGSVGAIVLVVALVLGATPFVLQPSFALDLVGFGLSAAAAGRLLSDWLTIAWAQGYVQSLVAGAGSGVASTTWLEAGSGLYCGLVGFALLCYVYARSLRTRLRV